MTLRALGLGWGRTCIYAMVLHLSVVVFFAVLSPKTFQAARCNISVCSSMSVLALLHIVQYSSQPIPSHPTFICFRFPLLPPSFKWREVGGAVSSYFGKPFPGGLAPHPHHTWTNLMAPSHCFRIGLSYMICV